MRSLINKKNIYLLVLLVICLLGIVIVPTYAKFGSSYATDDDVVGLLLDFNLSITNIEEYQVVFVPAGESKVYNIEIENGMASTAYYGVWYRMVSPSEITSDITIARLSGSSISTSGSIATGNTITVSIVVLNNSTSSVKFDVGVSSSVSSTGDIEYLDGKTLITGTASLPEDEEDLPLLTSVVSAGDYISYTGNNGCSGNACSGQNANYSSSNLGYCSDSNNSFTVSGWRVAYISSGIVYLISAGAPECMSTDSSGNASSISVDSSGDLTSHFANLDAVALKYCNATYAYGGTCSSSTAWAMDATDFQNITGKALSYTSCYEASTDTTCGYGNTLIDNGSYYWFAKEYYGMDTGCAIIYTPTTRDTDNNVTKWAYGVRPVIKLSADIKVSGGSGTSASPYTITI